MKYRVIAFDYDGTLVDTFRFHVNTIGRIVRECGACASKEEIARLVGIPLDAIFEQTLPKGKNEEALLKLKKLYKNILPSDWQNMKLIEICYLFHQIVIFLYTFMKTACMLYLSLPMLLSVKSLIFYFPSVSSGMYYLFCITFGNPDACNLGECCFFHLSFCHLSFTVIDQVHIKLMEHNFILILNICSNGFFFRKCTIFFCY